MSDSPASEERLKPLHDALQEISPAEILRISLAAKSKSYDSIPNTAKALIPYTRVICLDTESYTNNSDLLTELGIVQISYQQVKGIQNPGDYGSLLLDQLRFLHFRLVEHAHLIPDTEHIPENLFGHTRFTTLPELRTILHGLLNTPINVNEGDPLKGCLAPVVLVGHALHHDLSTISRALHYDVTSNNTVVARVDTQPLSRQVGVYVRPANDNASEISLRNLAEKIGLDTTSSHSACNDSARTMVCALNILLPSNLRRPVSATRTLREVVKGVQDSSKARNPPPFGTANCCVRCGSRDHSEKGCNVAVICAACKTFDPTDRTSHTVAHIETYCLHVAAFKASIRRVLLAQKKYKGWDAFLEEFTGKTTAETHPWSSWSKARWPTDDPFQAIADHTRYPEEPLKVPNLQVALHNFAVPVEGEWVLNNGSTRPAPAGPRRPSYAAAAATPSPATPSPATPSPATPSPVSTAQQGTTSVGGTLNGATGTSGRGAGSGNWRAGGGNWRTGGGTGGRDLGGNWRAGGGGA